MNSKVRPYHIHSILDNLLDMGFIETMGRPRKKSERKNSTEHPRSVPSKLKTTLSEAYFEAPKQGVLRVVLNFEDFVRGSPMEIFGSYSSFGQLLMYIERILKRLFYLQSIFYCRTFHFINPPPSLPLKYPSSIIKTRFFRACGALLPLQIHILNLKIRVFPTPSALAHPK